MTPPHSRSSLFPYTTLFRSWRFEWGTAQEVLCRQFGVTSLEGFGCAGKPLAVRAAGALVAYVKETNRPLLALLDGIRTRSEEHTSELQSRFDLVCRLLLEKK